MSFGTTSGRAWLTRGLALAGVALAAVACAPPVNHALNEANRQYGLAATDPAVVRDAPGPLAEARSTIDQANARFNAGDQDETTHLAGVAQTQIARAREITVADEAKGTSAHLSEERTDALVAARTRDLTTVVQELAAFQARETTRGLELTLSDVSFRTDSADLTPDARANLTRLAGFLQANPDRDVVIEGHTDSTGRSGYNLDLSMRRAQAVRSYLIASGVRATRLQANGFGEGYPIASNQTEFGRQRNRRVEMLVMNPGERVAVSSAPIIR